MKRDVPVETIFVEHPVTTMDGHFDSEAAGEHNRDDNLANVGH